MTWLLKKENRMTLRLIAIVLEGLFALGVIIMFLNMSFGWFAQNKQVSGHGMAVKVDRADARAEFLVYVYDAKDSDVHYTGQSVDKNGNAITFTPPTISNLDMQFHDTIFVQRNRYTPAVIRIRLTELSEQWENGGTVAVKLTRNTDIAAYGETEQGALALNEYFTSVMRFTLAQDKTWKDDAAYTNGILNTYYNVDSALYTKIVTNENYSPANSSAVFTTATVSGSTLTGIEKSDSVTVKIPYTASDIVGGELNIYLYVTYDTDLVALFEQAAGIDTSGTAIGKITTMENDLTSLDITFEQTT